MEERNLYYLNAKDEKILVKENVYAKDIEKLITDYIYQLNPNYKINYFRSWTRDSSLNEKSAIIYDFGSHYEFFIWE